MSALSEPPTMAFLCRADLQLSAGKLAVQCAHAAIVSLKQPKKTHSRMVQRWQETASRKICLAVDDEEDLMYFLGLVEEASLPHSLIQDAGLTEVLLEQELCLVLAQHHAIQWIICFLNSRSMIEVDSWGYEVSFIA